MKKQHDPKNLPLPPKSKQKTSEQQNVAIANIQIKTTETKDVKAIAKEAVLQEKQQPKTEEEIVLQEKQQPEQQEINKPSEQKYPKNMQELKTQEIQTQTTPAFSEKRDKKTIIEPLLLLENRIQDDKLTKYLMSLDFHEEELSKIPRKELDQLLNQSWYGWFLNAFASNHLLFKFFAFWFLDETAIKLTQRDYDDFEKPDDDHTAVLNDESNHSAEISRGIADSDTMAIPLLPLAGQSNLIKTKKGFWGNLTICCYSCKNYFSSRVWPRNKTILVESDTVLTRVCSIESGVYQLKWFNRIWSALVFSLLTTDIYTFYQYPERRYGNTLSKILFEQSDYSAMVSYSLTKNTVWPVLLGIPIFFVLYEIASKTCSPTQAIPTKDITTLETYCSKHKTTWQSDFAYPLIGSLLPQSLVRYFGFNIFENQPYDFNNILKTILWDGSTLAEDRLRLFEALCDLLNYSAKLTKLNVLPFFEKIAENIHPMDIKRLYQVGYNKETIHILLQIQSRALAALKKHARWQGFSQILPMLYAHFLLWNIGQPESKILQPIFFIFQTYRWYAILNFFLVLSKGLSRILDEYYQRKACEAEGKLWIYMDQVAGYKCTVCGDLPIYYGHIFTNEDCIHDWLETKIRTPQELVAFVEGRIGKVNFSNMTNLNFKQQYLNGRDLARFLNALKIRAPSLQTLDLDMIRPLDKKVDPIDSIGMQSIVDFIKHVPIQELNLREQGLNGQLVRNLGQGLNISKLQTLNLNGNGIGAEGAKYIGQGLLGSSLQTLNLNSNGIGAEGAIAIGQGLPGSSLQTLYLDGNSIDDEGAKGIGQGLPGSSLQMLDLGLNHIMGEGAKSLSQGLPGSSLQTLDLSTNRIGDKGAIAIGQGLPGFSLQTLNLYSNGIGDEGAKGIGQGLPGSSLQTLGLECNYLIGDEGAKGIGQGLPGSSLQTLFLSGNKIGDEGAIAIGQGLPGSSLQRLDLTSDDIGAEGAIAIGQGLPSSPLQKLELGYNSIGAEGAKGIGQGLPGSSLQTLYLNDNSIGAEGAKGIGQGLPGSSLQWLNLNDNSMGAEGAKGIGQGLPGSSLQKLKLSYNSIGDAGAKGIGQGLPGSSLQELFLGYNSIGNKGAIAIGQGLPGSSLQRLGLEYNSIGAEGAKGISQGLLGSSLQVLGLEHNSVGAEGAKGIGQGLPGSSLQFLSLRSNSIGDKGAIAIGQGLPGSSLQDLYLTNNSIGDEGVKGIVQGLPGSSLQTLGLEFNSIGAEGAKGIGQGLPGSSLQILYLRGNIFYDEGAITIANALVISPFHTKILWIYRFDPDVKKMIAQFTPNTKLKCLNLADNHITNKGAEISCRIAPYSGIPSYNFSLEDNPITDVNLRDYCITSAATRAELFWPFSLLPRLYRRIKEFILPSPYHSSSAWIKEKADEKTLDFTKKSRGNGGENYITPGDKHEQADLNKISDRHLVFSSMTESINEAENSIIFEPSAITLFNAGSSLDPKSITTLHNALPFSKQQRSQNLNMVPLLVAGLLLGIALIWLYKKLFDTESQSPLMRHQRPNVG